MTRQHRLRTLAVVVVALSLPRVDDGSGRALDGPHDGGNPAGLPSFSERCRYGGVTPDRK